CLANGSTLITFDDIDNLTNSSYNIQIPNGYSNLQWSNVYILQASLYPSSGYVTALTSGQDVAFNWYGRPMNISSSILFTINSFIAASAWYDNNTVIMQGYQSGTLLYSQTVTLYIKTSLLVQLNWINIDNIAFTSSAQWFVMDNLCINGIASKYILASEQHV
ncbi:unnamed protein product, partial [Didymodactylos carnosus]